MKKFIAFLVAACLGVGAGVAVSVSFQVTGVTDNSMLPSYSEGETVLVNRISYRNSEPKRGDVILLPNEVYAVTGEGKVMMKRIIAIPGDTVLITGGKVYVNNKPLTEKYTFTDGTSGEMDQVKVDKGHVFVLGDNRAASTDSRDEAVGLIRIDDILGKVIYKW